MKKLRRMSSKTAQCTQTVIHYGIDAESVKNKNSVVMLNKVTVRGQLQFQKYPTLQYWFFFFLGGGKKCDGILQAE